MLFFRLFVEELIKLVWVCNKSILKKDGYGEMLKDFATHSIHGYVWFLNVVIINLVFRF